MHIAAGGWLVGFGNQGICMRRSSLIMALRIWLWGRAISPASHCVKSDCVNLGPDCAPAAFRRVEKITRRKKQIMNGPRAQKATRKVSALSLCNTFILGGGVREIIKSRCCARGNLKLFAARPKLPANNQTRIIQHRALLSAIKKNELLQQLRNKIALKTRRSARERKMFRGKSSGLIALREQYRLLNFIGTHKQNVLAQGKLPAMNLEL